MRTSPLLLLAALLASCTGTRKLVDPVLSIHTEGGTELGVSTTYGVVFLGATATSGRVEIEALFGDGPSIEASVIEPIGDGLYTAETEIRLPSVRLRFESPRPGDRLLVSGQVGGEPWATRATVRADPRVYGILLDVPSPIQGRGDQVGAGVFWVNPDDEHDKRLVGLVAGKVLLEDEGRQREYLAVVGPNDLWRLVTHRRDHGQRKRWIYRKDVL